MQSFRNYLLTLLVASILVSACVLLRYHAAYPGAVGPELDDFVSTQYLEALSAQQPQVVVLGDSMVQENVDAKALASRLGRSVYSIGYPGSSSAVWYLIVRHEIAGAPAQPQTLVILFRDTMLTQPSHRISPFGNESVDVFASMEDRLVLERAFLNQINPLGWLMEAYVPFYTSQGEIQAEVSQALRYGSARWVLGCNRKCVDDAVLTVLARNRMSDATLQQEVVSVESPLYSARALDFNARLEESFLPEIVRLCRENDIELIFVRSRKQYYAGMPAEPRGLQTYLDGLQDYLASQGAAYLDMNGDPRLVPSIYTDPVHVSEAGRQVFTQVLADLLAPKLAAP